MQVTLSERVRMHLRALSPEERERVLVWIDYLKEWDSGDFVKEHSAALNVQGRTVYMFRTNVELRIFYTVDEQGKSIEVVDVATRETILSFGGVSA